MPIEKKPFVPYTLDEDKKSPYDVGKIITVRLNAEEYRRLKNDMKVFNLRNESTCIKFLLETGHNVLHGLLGRVILRRLADPNRVKG